MESAPSETSLPPRSAASLFNIQFFLLPALVALPFVLLVAFVAYLSQETTDTQDLIQTVKAGTPHARWQAAMQLAARLARGEAGAVTADDLYGLWESDAARDGRVRQYLLLAFSRTPDPRLFEILAKEARDVGAGEEDERLYAVWSLSLWRDERARPVLLAALADESPAVRKMAIAGVAALPKMDTAAKREALAPLLADPSPDCRWNAALALAELGDERARPVLAQMLDRDLVAATPDITPQQVETVMLRAIEAARGQPDLADDVAALARSDPSPKVQSAARRAITEATR